MTEFIAGNHVVVCIDRGSISIHRVDEPKVQMIAVLNPTTMHEIAAEIILNKMENRR